MSASASATQGGHNKKNAITGVKLGFEADVVAMTFPRKLLVVADEALRVGPEQHHHLVAV